MLQYHSAAVLDSALLASVLDSALLASALDSALLASVLDSENGESYAQIAKFLNTKIKSVDTAIQRIRKKAQKIKNKIETE